MICNSYVKGNIQTPLLFDKYTNILLEFDRIEEDVNNAKYEYEAAYADYLLESEFLEADSDEAKKKNGEVQEKKRNFVEKIGHGIREIIKKAYVFISNIVEKLKGNKFKFENDLSKLAELKKKHPDLSDRIEIAFEEGKLNIKDAKSLADLDQDYLRIMKMENDAERSDAWVKAKQKFNDAQDIIEKAGKTAAAIITIATIGGAITKANNAAAQSKHNMNEDRIQSYIDARTKGDISGTEGVNTTKLKITREYTHINMANASAVQKFVMKIQDQVAGLLDKADSNNYHGSDRQAYHDKMLKDAQGLASKKDDNGKRSSEVQDHIDLQNRYAGYVK